MSCFSSRGSRIASLPACLRIVDLAPQVPFIAPTRAAVASDAKLWFISSIKRITFILALMNKCDT